MVSREEKVREGDDLRRHGCPAGQREYRSAGDGRRGHCNVVGGRRVGRRVGSPDGEDDWERASCAEVARDEDPLDRECCAGRSDGDEA